MAANLSPIERLTRDKAVLEQWLAGYTLKETAKILGLSRSAVEMARKSIVANGAASLKEGSEEVVVSHVIRLREIQAECRKAYERSKLPAVKSKTKRVPIVDGAQAAGAAAMLHQENSVEGRDGNPAYLLAELKAMDDERRVLGIAVDKLALTSPDGKRPYDPQEDERIRRGMAELMGTAVRRQLAASNTIDTTAVAVDDAAG